MEPALDIVASMRLTSESLEAEPELALKKNREERDIDKEWGREEYVSVTQLKKNKK